MPNAKCSMPVVLSSPRMSSCATIIILTYNGRSWLPACLDAIAAQRGAPAFDVLVVDNGRSDGSGAFGRERRPGVRALEIGSNLGFAEGNNRGAREANGDWLVFLNNDTAPEPAWLASLMDEAAAHPACDLVT